MKRGGSPPRLVDGQMDDERKRRIISAVETAIVLLAFVPLWLWMFCWRGGWGDWVLYGTLAILLVVAARRVRRLVAWGKRPPSEGGP